MTFRRKVTLRLILLTTGLVGLAAAAVFPRALEENRQGVRRMVRGIAATAALFLDGDLHETLPADPSAMAMPAYAKLQHQLKQVLGANPGIRYIWTMVEGDTPGQPLFVLDAGGSQVTPPGTPYDASRAPQLLAGFKGPAADRRLVRDPWGLSLSGYAPIRNSAGRVVAVLGVDVYNQQLYLFQQQVRRWLFLFLALAVLLSLLGGHALARQISRPLDRLVQGMRRVEEGDLEHPIVLNSRDEFQQAAGAFNGMTRGLREARRELRESFLHALQSLTAAIEAKDPYTRGHGSSVTDYAVKMARVLAKSPQELETLQRLAALHDVGKIGVRDTVLGKAAAFSEEEWQAMKQHPRVGEKILQPLGLSPEELALILSHHEREDGTGYPRGLDRSSIPDLVAIVSVADAYDAMVSHRPYRGPMKPAEALAELRRSAGTQFRPEAVEALAIVLEKEQPL